MSDDASLDTFRMKACLGRMREGDKAASDELVRGALSQMERLARKMLRRFPRVRQCTETGDVLQSSLMRLLRALQQVQPASTREFYALAATQIRRELLDLARHYNNPARLATHRLGSPFEDAPADVPEPPARVADGRDLDRWAAFHQEVEKLPAEEREVVSLIFYHGWSQAAVADLFQITVRTVQRRWQSALTRLQSVLGETDGLV